jgi:peptidoglycan/xylan/chitin deacetylase (PgdA/CDA1 family)
MVLLRWVLIVLFLSRPLAGMSQGRTVAMTIDDLPYAGDDKPASSSQAVRMAGSVNRTLLSALKRHHAPATGFVIESGVQQLGAAGPSILKLWMKQGFDLGNHTYSHQNYSDVSEEEFEAEIIKGERTFRPLMERKTQSPQIFFRFPYNDTGDTKQKHDEIANFLAHRGYRLAPCTIDTEDYFFNSVYIKMLARHNDTAAAKLRSAYLAYTSEEIDYYAALNKQVLGYEPPQIMLLHDSRLNADLIGQILRMFVKKGYKFVSLQDAEVNPAYQIPDSLVTKYGMMWGYRWAHERGVKVNGVLEKEPPGWIGKYGETQ